MKLSIGIDVHKEKCVAYAKFAGKGEPRPAHQEFMDGFNEKFRRFSSDSKGMTELAEYLKGHSVHILIENSTKSHDVIGCLGTKGLRLRSLMRPTSSRSPMPSTRTTKTMQ